MTTPITQLSITDQTTPPIAPVDPTPIITHGDSPTAIILAVAILISILLKSVTGLIRVIGIVMLHQSKSSR